MEPKIVKLKICLLGEEGVGKTSLIRRFVSGAFDDAYIRTLGAVVSKKSLDLQGGDGTPVHVDMVILDIIGKRTFMQLFKDAYFSGARGIIAVFDLTRKATLRELPAWIAGVRETVGQIPVEVLANKDDVKERHEVREDEIASILGPLNVKTLRTSAKSGENVERAFRDLAGGIVLEEGPAA
ncbi:MAG: GTP-binding protein [Methanobacteriota archaeon]|nr:MAG: GTP-binding protein [Euryarchaeota archaeon]